MKKYGKRLGAILTASLMAFSMATPAFGVAPGEVVGAGTFDDLAWPGYTLTGSLPTGAALAFAIDPFGHLTVGQNDPIDPANRNHQVVFEDSLARATNSSSADVILTATMRLVGATNSALPAHVEVVPTVGDVNIDDNSVTARHVLIWAQPSREAITTAPVPAGAFTGADGAFAIPGAADAETAKVLTYHLEGIPSVVYAVDVDGNGRPTALARRPATVGAQNSVALNFGGIFNPHASWIGGDSPQLRLVANFTLVAVAADANLGENPYLVVGEEQFAHGLLGAVAQHALTNDSPARPAPTPIALPRPRNAVTVVSASATGATGEGTFAGGTTVAIDAGTRDGYAFTGWTAVPTVTFADANSAVTTFEMPDTAVTVTAGWQEITGELVTVTSEGIGASGGGHFEEDATVTINAGTRDGYTFAGWIVTVGGVTLANANSAETTFVMGSEPVTVVANWAPTVDFTVSATTTLNDVRRWSVAEPLRIQFTQTPRLTAAAGTNPANLGWEQTHANGNWSYDPVTGIFEIGRIPGGTVFIVRVGDVTVTINTVPV